MAKADRNNKKFHKWHKLNSSQSRCTKCGCIKTSYYGDGKRTFKYQDNESKIHMEYLECIEEIDNSEFY